MRLNKNKKINGMFCSTNMLYVVFLVFLINFFQFLHRKDYESIFLFIVVSACVYLFNKNMVFVLIIPLIFVNTLILMRFLFTRKFSAHEGFTDSMGEKLIKNYDSLNKQLVQQWITTNLNSTSDDDKEILYTKFDEKLVDGDDKPYDHSLKELIENIKNNKLSKDSSNYNTKPVEDLEVYVTKIMTDALMPSFREKHSKEYEFVSSKLIGAMKSDFEMMETEIVEEDDNDNDLEDEDNETEKKEGEKEEEKETNTLSMEGMNSDPKLANLSDLNKGTQDLVAQMDKLNPVMEKSMEILKNMDVGEMKEMMKTIKGLQ